MVYGKPLSSENKNKDTYYLVQDFVKGDILRDRRKELKTNEHLKNQLIVIAILSLYLYEAKSLMPDFRPAVILTDGANWFVNTNNIVIGEDDCMKIIDTRWMWSLSLNIVQRGLAIPEMTRMSITNFLNSGI